MRFAALNGSNNQFLNAGMNSSGNLNEILGKIKPNWTAIAGAADKSRLMEEVGGLESEMMTTRSGLQGLGIARKGQFEAEAIEAQGQASKSAGQAEGIGGLIGSIGGGLMDSFGGSGGGLGSSFTGNSLSGFGSSFGAFQPGTTFNVPSVF